MGGVQGDLEVGAFIESLPKKQIHLEFLPQLRYAGDFPSTNKLKPESLLSEEVEPETFWDQGYQALLRQGTHAENGGSY